MDLFANGLANQFNCNEDAKRSKAMLKSYEEQLKSKGLTYSVMNNLSMQMQLNCQTKNCIVLPGSKTEKENLGHQLAVFAEPDYLLWIVFSAKLRFAISDQAVLYKIVDAINMTCDLGGFFFNEQGSIVELLFRNAIHTMFDQLQESTKNELSWKTMVTIDSTFKVQACNLLQKCKESAIAPVEEKTPIYQLLQQNMRKGTFPLIRKKVMKYMDTNALTFRRAGTNQEERFTVAIKAHKNDYAPGGQIRGRPTTRCIPAELCIRKHALSFKVFITAPDSSMAYRLKKGFTKAFNEEERKKLKELHRLANRVNMKNIPGKIVVSESTYYAYYEVSWDYHMVPIKFWSKYIAMLVTNGLQTYLGELPQFQQLLCGRSSNARLQVQNTDQKMDVGSHKTDVEKMKASLIQTISEDLAREQWDSTLSTYINSNYQAICIDRLDILNEVQTYEEMATSIAHITHTSNLQFVEVSRDLLNENYLKKLRMQQSEAFFATYGLVRVVSSGTFYVVREGFDGLMTLQQYAESNQLTKQDKCEIYGGLANLLKEIHARGIYHYYLHINGVYVNTDTHDLKLVDPLDLQIEPQDHLINPQLFKKPGAVAKKRTVKANRDLEAWGCINIFSFLHTGRDMTQLTAQMSKSAIAKWYNRKKTGRMMDQSESAFLDLHRGSKGGNKYSYAIGLVKQFNAAG